MNWIVDGQRTFVIAGVTFVGDQNEEVRLLALYAAANPVKVAPLSVDVVEPIVNADTVPDSATPAVSIDTADPVVAADAGPMVVS